MIKNNMNTTRKRKSLWKIFLGFFASIIFYGSIAIVVASLATSLMNGGNTLRIFGFSSYFIETFSMDSVMPAGSLIIAKQQESDMYKVGDDISFYDVSKNGNIVTHRIVDIEEDNTGLFYVTKGVDNEKNDDENVYEGNVIGKIVMVVPEVGIYISYIRENIILVAGFIVGLWILIKYLKDLIRNNNTVEKTVNATNSNSFIDDYSTENLMNMEVPCEGQIEHKTKI